MCTGGMSRASIVQYCPAKMPGCTTKPRFDEMVSKADTKFHVLLPADGPARDLMTVAVCGGRGKTTVSWLVRGILEEMEQVRVDHMCIPGWLLFFLPL